MLSIWNVNILRPLSYIYRIQSDSELEKKPADFIGCEFAFFIILYADLPTSMKFRNSLRIFLPITEKARNYGKFLQITDFLKLWKRKEKSSRRAQKQADGLLRPRK